MKEIAKATAETFRDETECEMIWGAPPVTNDADMTELATDCARDVVGDDIVMDHLDALDIGGEDFTYYLEKAPEALMSLNSSSPQEYTGVLHHNPRFDADGDVP